MATRERWITGAVERGVVTLEQATAVVDYICETDGGGPMWIPLPPGVDGRLNRNGKIVALWSRGVGVAQLAERFGITPRHVRRIITLFASRN